MSILQEDRINYVNIGLMAVTAVLAYFMPFETFLIAYAFLGPLHYLTEISWLHDRQYFSKGKYDFLVLLVVGILLSVAAFANDFGYDEIFARQLEGLGKKGDVLVVLSSSGNSENILRVLQKANGMGITSIALLGKGGGQAVDLSDFAIVIESEETARIQEMHLVLGHTLCEYAEIALGVA